MSALKTSLLLLALAGCATSDPGETYAPGTARNQVLRRNGLPNRSFLRPETGSWSEIVDRESGVALLAGELGAEAGRARRCDVYRVDRGDSWDYFFYDEESRLVATRRRFGE